MIHRTRLTVIFTGLLLTASAMAAPHGPRGERWKHHGGPDFAQTMLHLGHAVRQLDLSEDQREAIHTEFEAFRESFHPLAEELRENRLALREVITADEYDAEAAAAIAQKQGELTTRLVTVSADAAAAVLGRLTDEQRAELKEQAEFRREHREEHREMKMERRKEWREARRPHDAPPGD